MRSLMLGLVLGLFVGATLMLLVLGDSIGMTGAAIVSTGSTVTLPANTILDREALGVDIVIRDGRASPSSIAVAAGEDVELSVLAATGPAMILIPEFGFSTPLLSNRQVYSFVVRFDEPGSYEAICRPCGSMQSLESLSIVVR